MKKYWLLNILGLVFLLSLIMGQDCCPAYDYMYTFGVNGNYDIIHRFDASGYPGIRATVELKCKATLATAEDTGVVSGQLELVQVKIGNNAPLTPEYPVQANIAGTIVTNSTGVDFNPFTLTGVPLTVGTQKIAATMTIDMAADSSKTVQTCEKNATALGGLETVEVDELFTTFNGGWEAAYTEPTPE